MKVKVSDLTNKIDRMTKDVDFVGNLREKNNGVLW